MSFSTKKYTRPLLLTELRRVRATRYESVSQFVENFSPRAGLKSAKVAALKSLVGAKNFNNVFRYNSGVYAKNLLISLLKNS